MVSYCRAAASLPEVRGPALMLPGQSRVGLLPYADEVAPFVHQVGEITPVLPAAKTAAARAEIILTETLR